MKEILQFLTELSQHNNREWFDANRSRHTKAKNILEPFVDELIGEIYKVDPSIGVLKARDCVFRIFRDTRFSSDKTPYKNNMGAFIARGGRKSEYAGYYIHLEPGGRSFAGGGLYMPPGERLRPVRQEIYYHVDEFRKILKAKAFVSHFRELDKWGDELKKAPQGFDPAWPDIELLKYKNYVVGEYFSDAEVGSDAFMARTVSAFRALHPLNAFLNRALEIPRV